MNENMKDHIINEYKYSKINPKLFVLGYGKANCQVYAPYTIQGRCRFCSQLPNDHKRWFEYSLKCIKIQNNWRLNKITRKINFIKENILVHKFGDDISEVICSHLLKQNGDTYKKLHLNYKNFI